MNVCFFGSFDPEYSRNRILIDGLKKNECKVYYCNSKSSFFLRRYFELIKQYWPVRNKVEIIFVAFVGQLNMPLAWFLGKLTNKNVVFDMFLSFYETYVFDRQVTKPNSLRAKIFYWTDKMAVFLSDIVITDTISHANYFAETFKTNKNKIEVIYVGGDDKLFKPRKKDKSDCTVVEFHGIFTRLQGAETFIKAAKLLENKKSLQFLLIGSSNNYEKPIHLLHKLRPKNLTYFKKMPIKDLAKLVAKSHITIGHLGRTQKAKLVISNKIYQGLSCGNALICGDSAAVRELFTNKNTALFVKMGDENDLVDKLIELAQDVKLRKILCRNGRNLVKNRLTNKFLGLQLLEIIRGFN